MLVHIFIEVVVFVINNIFKFLNKHLKIYKLFKIYICDIMHF